MKPSVALLCASLTLEACASLPPGSAELAALPVVRFGQPAPADQPFILHYPAGTSLPVIASVRGNLLERPDQATLSVTLKTDLYTYKTWASRDGKIWQRGADLVSGHLAMTLPGELDGRNPGTLGAEFNLR